MHLPERGCGDRLGIELGERLGQPHAQLGFHDFLDLRERERLDLVLQPL
jgi:hypothetical protein